MTAADAAASGAAAAATLDNGPMVLTQVFPTGWPHANALVVFGLLRAFGVLGRLLAARARWLPSITGFMILGLLVGPSGLGLLSPQALGDARVLVDIALGLILFKLGVTLHPVKAMRNKRLQVTSLAESLVTFALILALILALMLALMPAVDAPTVVAVLAAAIAVSSSPAVLIHVAEELRAKGPVAKLGTVYLSGFAFQVPQRQSLASGMLRIPMAGLAIGLAQTITQLMRELGSRVAAIVLAAVAVFETIGPPIAALALRMAGEAGKADSANTKAAPPQVQVQVQVQGSTDVT